MMLLLFLLLSTLANSDGEGTNNSLALKMTRQNPKSYRLSRGPCDENWFYFPPLNSCYRFFRNLHTMKDAEEYCKTQHSGHLASVISSIHNNFISDVVSAVDESKPRAWIGLNDRSEEGNFTWIDGTSYTYGGWTANEPNDYLHQEDCVIIHYFPGTPEWNDYPCANEHGFICAYKCQCI